MGLNAAPTSIPPPPLPLLPEVPATWVCFLFFPDTTQLCSRTFSFGMENLLSWNIRLKDYPMTASLISFSLSSTATFSATPRLVEPTFPFYRIAQFLCLANTHHRLKWSPFIHSRHSLSATVDTLSCTWALSGYKRITSLPLGAYRSCQLFCLLIYC